MSDSLTPTEGARFLLERDHEQDGGTSAVYRTAIYTPSATYEGSATLSDDGTAILTDHLAVRPADEPAAEPTRAPDELVAMLQMLAKLTARSAPKKREDGLPPWPARVLRWRGAGRGE